MIKPIYLIILASAALLILAGCGVLASETQVEEAPTAEAAPEESAVEVIEAEAPAPMKESLPMSEVETEVVVEVENEAAAEVKDETVAEQNMPEPEVMVEETEPAADESVEVEMAEAETMPEKEAEVQPVAEAAGPSAEQQALLDELTVLGQPPELTNEIWLNSEPLKLADLHGQVVIVEFWTFG